jgi:hypothetical protein
MMPLILFLYIYFIFLAILSVVHFMNKKTNKSEDFSDPIYQPPIITEETPKDQLLEYAIETLYNQDLITFEKITEVLMQQHDIDQTSVIKNLDLSFPTLCTNRLHSSIFYLLKNHRSIVETKFDSSSLHKDFIDDIIELQDNQLLALILPLVRDRVNKMNYDNWTTPLCFSLLQKPPNYDAMNLLFDYDANSFSISNPDLCHHEEEPVFVPIQIYKRFEKNLTNFNFAFLKMIVKTNKDD